MRALAPYAVLGALVGGIAVGERLGPGSATVPLAVALVLVVVVLAASRRSVRAAALVLAAAAAGCASVQRAIDGLVHSPLATPVASRADVSIEGTLVEDPLGTRFTARALVRVRRVRADTGTWRDAGGRTVLVVADASAGPRLGVLAAGDEVVLRGWLSPLDGYDERLRWRHAVARLSASELLAFERPASPLMRVANTVRGTALRGTALLPQTERGLVAAFLVGDTRELPKDVLERFRAAGLSHLLVVSGENVAFVLALLGPALRRLPRVARLVATCAVLLLFGAMTRWEPSVLRASVMAACAVVAVHLGRPAPALRTLAIAATVLVTIDPFLVHSVGFLLSCGACLGIALLAPGIAARLPGPAWLRESAAVTVGAQAGVAPVLLPVFGSMPLVTVPANLLAVPIAGPLTVCGLATSVTGGVLAPAAPAIARGLQIPTNALADGMLGVADAASRVPISVDARAIGALAATVALVVTMRHTRMLRRDATAVSPR